MPDGLINESIQIARALRRLLNSDGEPGTVPSGKPASGYQILVRLAYGVVMDSKRPCEGAHTWQLLAVRKSPGCDQVHKLLSQLLVQRDIAVFTKRKAHGN